METAVKNSPEVNQEIANTILQQIGFMVRGCLDMKNCYFVENGVIALNAIVGHNKRGAIKITLNGNDLYDITATRVTQAKGEHVVHEWSNVYASDLRSTLDSIWR